MYHVVQIVIFLKLVVQYDKGVVFDFDFLFVCFFMSTWQRTSFWQFGGLLLVRKCIHCTPSHIFPTDKVTIIIIIIIEREIERGPTQYYSRHVELVVVVEDGWCRELSFRG